MGAAAIRTAFAQETEEAARMARRRQSTACELRKLSELRPLHDLGSSKRIVSEHDPEVAVVDVNRCRVHRIARSGCPLLRHQGFC